jgi:hypothetical protein
MYAFLVSKAFGIVGRKFEQMPMSSTVPTNFDPELVSYSLPKLLLCRVVYVSFIIVILPNCSKEALENMDGSVQFTLKDLIAPSES